MPTVTISEFIPPDRLVLSDGRELTVFFDEDRVPDYKLPDPLIRENGEAVKGHRELAAAAGRNPGALLAPTSTAMVPVRTTLFAPSCWRARTQRSAGAPFANRCASASASTAPPGWTC